MIDFQALLLDLARWALYGLLALWIVQVIFLAAVAVFWCLQTPNDPEAEWCGCDGEGMAHLPGAAGFLCGPDLGGEA